MSLPNFKTDHLPLSLMQSKWKALLDPVLSNSIIQGHILSAVKLALGPNVINHLLGRKLVGWFVVGINGVADIYDTQADNQSPSLTLNLNSSAAVTVNLWVF